MKNRFTQLDGGVHGIVSRYCVSALSVVIALASAGFVYSAAPDLQTSLPRGGQLGTEVKVTFTGNRLSDAEEVLFHGEGITAKDVKPIDAKKVEATLVIAPDCRLGEHHLRLRCRSGISYARNFWVSQFPNVDEVEPNDDFAKPQPIALNVTVEGSAKPEETDYYKVTAKKGDRLSIEVEGLRINTRRQAIAIDPFVTIYDQDRFELGSADGSALLKQDSILSVIIPEDGDYTIEIRDAAYQGVGRYRAHIGTFPRPTGIYPLGGEAGKELEFTFLGDVKGSFTQKATLPESAHDQTAGVIAKQGEMQAPSPNPVRISDFPNVLEKGENNALGMATESAGSLPLAFNGILEKPDDTDVFRFTAKKGQSYKFKVFASELGSPVDPVINIYDAKNKNLGGSDDADGTKDGRIDFKAPADGDYLLRIRDMLSRGGDDFVYRIESLGARKTIEVTMPEMLRRDLQYRRQFDIPQGGYYAMTVNIKRVGVKGELEYEIPSLPKGVSIVGGTIPSSANNYPILLKAEADAPIGGDILQLNVKTTDSENVVSGSYVQPLDLVRGPQNGVEYYTKYYPHLAVSVVEPHPYSISIEQPKIPIVRGGTLKLKVIAKRNEGYENKITVRLPWKPAGISAPATMTFDKGATELEYELNANGNAVLGTWPITLIADSEGGKGNLMSGAPYIDLAVEEPYVDMKLNLTTAKQGEAVEMLATLDGLRDFEGEAEVQLFGLPAHATTPVAKVTKDTEEFNFPIQTSEKTPVGQHKNMFCTVKIMKNGQPIIHRVGMGGALRVDPKPKEVVAKAPTEAKKVAKNEPKEKPLSRLEQLRLDAQKESSQ